MREKEEGEIGMKLPIFLSLEAQKRDKKTLFMECYFNFLFNINELDLESSACQMRWIHAVTEKESREDGFVFKSLTE